MKEDYFGLTFILWQINLKAVFKVGINWFDCDVRLDQLKKNVF